VVRFVFTALLFLSAGWARAQDAILQPAPDRVDVVALMVEFQPDTTRFTTGNGTFAGPLFPGVDAPKIDPLPHNADYFDAHLRFLEHYVGRVSDGKTTVKTHLLPEVIRVSKPMGAYSPTGLDAGTDAELTKLSALVKEAWTLADQSAMTLPSGLDPATTAFVIFHAGVGRDIELVGTTLDKTPEDLPSIFFGRESLQRLGTSGIAMDGFPISNSLIIPRTESRMGVNPLTQEPFLVELSINGMLAASFFNWLGVPDLFNTEDGSSAIGPFGLMDALGIFAYSGLFPPEPSAWTKQYLGWADDSLDQSVWLGDTAHVTYSGHPGRNQMARIPISASEYFLAENRHRDPEEDGVRLQVWTHEGEREVVFPNGDPEFNDRTIEGFPGGVVLAVDHYDFALPGGVDENNNPLLGGILIWHVDEHRLRAGLEDNRVNADPQARAIDLEEADGAQDIGFGTGGGFFSANFDLGTPFDFWYEGNPVTVRTSSGQDIRLYENRFAEDTQPASFNNAGGKTGITLSDFSEPGPIMSFRMDGGQFPATDAPFAISVWTLPPALAGPISFLPDPSGNTVWAWSDGSWAGPRFLCQGRAAIRPVATAEGLLFLQDDALFFMGRDCEDSSIQLELPADSRIWTTPNLEWTRLPGQLRLHAGVEDVAGPALLTFTIHDAGRVEYQRLPLPEPVRSLFVESRTSPELILVTDSGVRNGQGDQVLAVDLGNARETAMAGNADAWILAWTTDAPGEGPNLVDSSGRSLPLPAGDACVSRHPAWQDIDGDGSLDLSYSCGNAVMAVHQSGAMLEGFPVTLPAQISAQPVFARDAAGATILVVHEVNSYAHGLRYDAGRWDRLEWFPLAGNAGAGSPPFVFRNTLLVGSNPSGRRFMAFPYEGATSTWERGLMVPHPASGPGQESTSRLLVERESYNWPNPIRTGSTRIRFEVQEPSSVEIDIVDMSGKLVDRLQVESAVAGIPTEVQWQTQAGSGVYLARVTARSLTSSRSDTRLIRMAIIR
jgi:hypothetical protein